MTVATPAETPDFGRRPGLTTLAAFGGLLGLGLAVHWGLWNNQWYQDDWLWLRIARDIARSPSALFAPDVHNSEAVLRFTQRVVMGLTYQAAGAQPGAYHVVSIVLQAMAATAVFRLLRVMIHRFDPSSRPVPWAVLGAVLYVSSSNHAMAVQWAAAQSTILATIVATVLLTVWIQREERMSERATWLAVTGLFALALYSKNTVVTIPLALATTIVLLPFSRPRPASLLTAGLAMLAAAHIAITKFLLPKIWAQAGVATDQGQFGLSIDTIRNLLGSVLGGFVSAKAYDAWGVPLPFQVAAFVLVAILLLLASGVGVLRPVSLGLIWIVVLSVPTAFLDYLQYDPVQLTVNRYEHLPLVGATLATTFLSLGIWRRLGKRRVVAVAIGVLLLLHVGVHLPMIRDSQATLRTWGDTEKIFLDHILQRAQASMPKGTTIYAVDWHTGDAYVASMDALIFAERGYTLAGKREFLDLLAKPHADPVLPPWVAVYDDDRGEFGVVPLSQYMKRRERPGLSP